MKAFVVLGRTLKAVYEELFVVVAVSLLWWAGTLLIVTAAPATMGLHAVANRAANYRRTGTEFFWSEGRRSVGRSWLLYAAIVAVGALIPANIWFYSGYGNWVSMIAFVWISVFVLYLMVAQYLFPCSTSRPSRISCWPCAMRRCSPCARRSTRCSTSSSRWP
jgi:uncharacterized membrane protein YesL